MTKFKLTILILLITAFGVVVSGCIKKPLPAVNTNQVTDTNVATTTAEVDTSTWKTYRNEKYGFEFKYPGDWKVEKCSGVSIIYLVPNEVKTDCYDTFSWVISFYDRKYRVSDFNNWDYKKITPGTINGIRTTFVQGSYRLRGEETDSLDRPVVNTYSYYFSVDDKSIMAWYTELRDNKSKILTPKRSYLDIYNDITQSFRFIE